MKKPFMFLISATLSLLCLFAFVGCSPKGYDGTEVTRITYSSVDYFGGYTEDYLFDFTSGTASKRAYLPYSENGIPKYSRFADFTKSAATIFFDKCYVYGLFALEESYTTTDVVQDGGGWSLKIEYADGTTFSSTGDNAYPTKVFDECKFAFYELCGDGVVGSIPLSYLLPPDVSVSFGYKTDNGYYSDNAIATIRRGNYRWNGHSVSDTSYYKVNQELSESNEFYGNNQYTLTLFTANYGDRKKFDKFTLSCYDYNNEMRGEQVLLSSKWFKQKEVPLQPNKIYIYKLSWSNGDFAEYTFNTKMNG